MSQTFVYDQIMELNKTYDILIVCEEFKNRNFFPFENVSSLSINRNFTSRLKTKLTKKGFFWFNIGSIYNEEIVIKLNE